MRENTDFAFSITRSTMNRPHPRVLPIFRELVPASRLHAIRDGLGVRQCGALDRGPALCVRLKHGEHYKIVLREGLPSIVNEALLRQATMIYVATARPRAFTARIMYCPARAGRHSARLRQHAENRRGHHQIGDAIFCRWFTPTISESASPYRSSN